MGDKMKNQMKKSIMILLSFVLLLVSFNSVPNLVNAETLPENLEELNPNDVKNLDVLLDKIFQSKEDIISSYWLDEKVKSGVINIYNEIEEKYYNLYIEKDTITYYSTQYYVNKETEDANFELYSVNKDNSTVHEFTSSIFKETGEVEHAIGTYSTNNAVYKWACIFSSYVSCAVAAGTLGFGIAGPFGATAATIACRYVFQTLVEKYGSKGAACKLFS